MMGFARVGAALSKNLARSNSGSSVTGFLSRNSSGKTVNSVVSHASVTSPLSRTVPVRQPEFRTAPIVPMPQSARVKSQGELPGLHRSLAFRIPPNRTAQSPRISSRAVTDISGQPKPPTPPPKPAAYKQGNAQNAFQGSASSQVGAPLAYQPFQRAAAPTHSQPTSVSYGGGQKPLPYPMTPSPQSVPSYQTASQRYMANNPVTDQRIESPALQHPKSVSHSYTGDPSGFTATQNSGTDMRNAITKWENQLARNPYTFQQ